MIFFTTPRHPELISGSHFYFFKNGFWFFSFLFLLYFYFFHKNYYHFTNGKEPARSPKPAVSFPLNPFLLGHGLGHRPKNPPTSKVSSVSCEQIRVALFFFSNNVWSFLSHCVIPNSFRDLIFFSKIIFDSFYHTTSSRTRFGISHLFFQK